MKRLLLMAFVSVAMMTMAACSDDEESTPAPDALVGTHWVSDRTIDNVPMVGTLSFSASLDFVSATRCYVMFEVEPSVPGFNLAPGEREYSFDGSKVLIATGSALLGSLELAYRNERLVYSLPASVANLLPQDVDKTIVFTRVD
ncbi:MAG: hypothetical protein IJ745_06100 [Bacteroidales bacterium]|nr:hypothetical protein [Bacteroidales bacterium]